MSVPYAEGDRDDLAYVYLAGEVLTKYLQGRTGTGDWPISELYVFTPIKWFADGSGYDLDFAVMANWRVTNETQRDIIRGYSLQYGDGKMSYIDPNRPEDGRVSAKKLDMPGHYIDKFVQDVHDYMDTVLMIYESMPGLDLPTPRGGPISIGGPQGPWTAPQTPRDAGEQGGPRIHTWGRRFDENPQDDDDDDDLWGDLVSPAPAREESGGGQAAGLKSTVFDFLVPNKAKRDKYKSAAKSGFDMLTSGLAAGKAKRAAVGQAAGKKPGKNLGGVRRKDNREKVYLAKDFEKEKELTDLMQEAMDGYRDAQFNMEGASMEEDWKLFADNMYYWEKKYDMYSDMLDRLLEQYDPIDQWL